jgi:hypothetical protein
MAKFHGSVAQAIHGLARNTVTAAADKAKLSLVRPLALYPRDDCALTITPHAVSPSPSLALVAV